MTVASCSRTSSRPFGEMFVYAPPVSRPIMRLTGRSVSCPPRKVCVPVGTFSLDRVQRPAALGEVIGHVRDLLRVDVLRRLESFGGQDDENRAVICRVCANR